MTDIRKLDPQVLLVFESLLETKSTTRSAAELGLSQSAISSALKRLRVIFDDPLFERHSRGLTPTQRASELSISVSHVLNSMRNLTASIEFEPFTAQGDLTFVASDLALATIVSPVRDRLAQLAPKMKLSINTKGNASSDLDVNVLSTDIVIAPSEAVPDNLQSRHLKSDEMGIIMASHHVLVDSEVTLEQLVSYPHVLVQGEGRGSSDAFDKRLAEQSLTRHIDTETNSYLSLQTLLGDSNRLAIGPRSLVDFSKGALTFKPLPLPPIEYHAAWHKRFDHDKRHMWLRRAFSSCVV